MNNVIGKIWDYRWILRSLPQTIWFNFHYLPLKQAWRLPILLYKPHFIHCKGTIRLSGDVRFGIVRLGYFGVSVYPNHGITLDLNGDIDIQGKCEIGNDSYISVGSKGNLVIGDSFKASCSLKIIAFYKIVIHEHVLIGWNTILLDTNFHRLKRVDGNPAGCGYGAVEIGNDTWICNNVEVTAGAKIPHHSVIQTHSIVLKNMVQESFSIYGGNPATLVVKGFYFDYRDDSINY